MSAKETTKEEFLIDYLVEMSEVFSFCANVHMSEYKKEGSFNDNVNLCNHFKNDCKDCVTHCVAVIFDEAEDLEEEG